MNGAVVEHQLLRGEAIEFVAEIGSGFTAIVAWSSSCEFVSLLIVDSDHRTLDAQRGQVAVASVFCHATAAIYVQVVMKERLLSQEDANAIDTACRFLNSRGLEGPLSPCGAWKMVRCAWLSSSVQSFVENDEEFCVFKRKLAVSSKKLAVPDVSSSTTVIDLLGEIHTGLKGWKQSSGSFSTLMRFLQKTKEEFSWSSEAFDGPLEIPL